MWADGLAINMRTGLLCRAELAFGRVWCVLPAGLRLRVACQAAAVACVVEGVEMSGVQRVWI
ncbi:hypothetical protein KPSA3_03882 [Pseudomonas syringae pv. actinidiae]|uniref:Uncharacterized protein n=1 Tax=Pseudomonas syringae pv. actinidiae TaxID=103796 RepID=A0AAN4Q6Q1_PSESF|nr:hypothetical protein KPSA3_03882 [Pseudomonas syringae pv. actinidiae]